MKYFTSDLHFGYEPILKQANRPFESIEQMNKASMIVFWIIINDTHPPQIIIIHFNIGIKFIMILIFNVFEFFHKRD